MLGAAVQRAVRAAIECSSGHGDCRPPLADHSEPRSILKLLLPPKFVNRYVRASRQERLRSQLRGQLPGCQNQASNPHASDHKIKQVQRHFSLQNSRDANAPPL
jgi:hypothetical protein